MFASTPDLLRLLIIPILGWAAWRDIKTRRVPNETWIPLAILAVSLFAWDASVAYTASEFARQLFTIRAGLSVGIVIPLSYLFWRIGGFGGADAKALFVIAVLFPTFPVYRIADTVLPSVWTPLGVFSLTILTNAVLIGIAYPVVLTLSNALSGDISKVMFVGKRITWDEVTRSYGRILETSSGFTRGGLDIDALRMYLRYRGLTLEELRANPNAFRDPATLPAEPNHPGDGALADGGVELEQSPKPDPADPAAADPWGAQAFLDDIDHWAYGTTPQQLREGLDLLVTAENVWISPGIPFIVPLFVGLLVALSYGDVLFAILEAIGLA
ncbi:prepilin peptidase [Haladaptatus sp. GCM10025707]|uniref:A24 family peptidase n=1 Tax=unclassified Haladaptatus TaxID=2622732 RepID=UPI0023E8A9BB|nr:MULTISPECIES: A24 family peptidase [unclassified Haladaptatus]